MSKIVISASSSHVAEYGVNSLLEGYFVPHTARVNYNLHQGLTDINNTDNYPLILEGTMGNYSVNVYVYSVTAGYGGTGPHTMVDILKSAGFKFDESEILTKKMADCYGNISLTYVR